MGNPKFLFHCQNFLIYLPFKEKSIINLIDQRFQQIVKVHRIIQKKRFMRILVLDRFRNNPLYKYNNPFLKIPYY